MRNKIIGLLGVLAIVFAIVGYFAFDNTLRQSSDMFGKELAVFKDNMKAGTVIQPDSIIAKKIKNEQRVPSAMTWEEAQSLIGKVPLIDMYANEQIILNRLGNPIDVEEGYKYVSFNTNFIDSVAGTLKRGDYIDIWIKPTPAYPTVGYKEPTKIFTQLKIETIKTESNQEIEQVPNGIPFVCIVRMTDEQIKVLKTYIPDQSSQNTFITIYTNQLKQSVDGNGK